MPTRIPTVTVPLLKYRSAMVEELPKGWIGWEEEAGPVTVDSSEDTIVSITVTLSADRLYRIWGIGQVTDLDNNSADGIIRVKEGATDLGRVHRHEDAAEESFMTGFVLVDGPSAGAHTYSLKGQTSAGDIGVSLVKIVVEDFGPAS